MADCEQPADDSADDSAGDSERNRRSFFAILAGGLTLLAPLGAGICAFLSPLFRRVRSPMVRVALLSQVPADGKPHSFPVVTDWRDAWNHYPQKKIGAVYLIRQPGGELPIAFTAKCPHAGCAIGYSAADEKFKCPCHTSVFNIDGSRARGDQEVAPRGMDALEVTLNSLEPEVEGGDPVTEILVKFIDYQTGHIQKKPIA